MAKDIYFCLLSTEFGGLRSKDAYLQNSWYLQLDILKNIAQHLLHHLVSLFKQITLTDGGLSFIGFTCEDIIWC